METDNISDFLKKLGMKSEKQDMWAKIIRPSTISMILGRKGKGKSALAYWLCEESAKRHNLLAVVINLPTQRRDLLPKHFVIRKLDDMPRLSDAVIIIDEGTTMLPAGGRKLEDMVKGYVALSRQRNQIILFVFHSSSDVGSRILRGVDAILLKEPSQRQIQHGAKDNWWRELLLQAKENFEAIEEKGGDSRCYTLVDSEEPEFRGMLENPLPSFWSEELSKAWAGIETLTPDLFTSPIKEFIPRGEIRGWHADDPEAKIKYRVTPQMEKEAIVIEEHIFQHSRGLVLEHPPTRIRWVQWDRY